MIHKRILNIPHNPKKIYDYAKTKAFDFWVDEKGTKDNPGVWQRKTSKLCYEDAFDLILHNKPHWVIFYRDRSLWNEESYWEFGGCNIGSNSYGEVFIWINVSIEDGDEIIKKFKLQIEEY